MGERDTCFEQTVQYVIKAAQQSRTRAALNVGRKRTRSGEVYMYVSPVLWDSLSVAPA